MKAMSVLSPFLSNSKSILLHLLGRSDFCHGIRLDQTSDCPIANTMFTIPTTGVFLG